MKTRIWLRVLFAIGILALAASASALEITFIANEGFLLDSGQGQKILIDGLFEDMSDFKLSADQINHVVTAQAPFNGISLILLTHFDGDHYDFGLLKRHLENDPQAMVVAPEEGSKKLVEAFPDRVVTVRVDEGKTRHLTLGGIGLEVLGLRHSDDPSYRNRHVGYLIDLGGKRLLHTGDFIDFSGPPVLPEGTGMIDVAFIHNMTVPPAAKKVIKMHYLPPPYKPMKQWIID